MIYIFVLTIKKAPYIIINTGADKGDDVIMEIEYAVISDIGKIRKENQDSVYFDGYCVSDENHFSITDRISVDKPILFAVFDGMGGECCGKEASEIACKVLKNNKSIELNNLCMKINDEICRFMQENDIKTMGTTAAIIKVDSSMVYICNIGDSKIYHITDTELKKISEDHVLKFGKNGTRSVLTQYLGIDEKEIVIEPYNTTSEVYDGDIYLICSDGLTDMIDEKEIFSTLKNNNISESAELLLETAISNGGKDNISFIILKINK